MNLDQSNGFSSSHYQFVCYCLGVILFRMIFLPRCFNFGYCLSHILHFLSCFTAKIYILELFVVTYRVAYVMRKLIVLVNIHSQQFTSSWLKLEIAQPMKKKRFFIHSVHRIVKMIIYFCFLL